MKKFISIVISFVLILSCFALTACAEEKPVIGIVQFGSHQSLNNCYDGVMKGLEESVDLSKYKVEYVNSNFSAETSLSQANKMVNQKAKVIIAIATPTAIQAATAASGKGVPVVYCAVTDSTQMDNFDNVTGTSDIPDFGAQLQLVTSFMGKESLKIGVLMSTEESSDSLQLSLLKEKAKKYQGMEIVERTVSDITAIDAHVNYLVSQNVDCLINLLDNTIVGKLSNILSITNQAKIPVFGSEIEQVKLGCLASASIDYITVGSLAGKQAAEILNGKNANDIAKKTMENETFPCFNSDVMKAFDKLSLPTNIENLKDIKDIK